MSKKMIITFRKAEWFILIVVGEMKSKIYLQILK